MYIFELGREIIKTVFESYDKEFAKTVIKKFTGVKGPVIPSKNHI